MSDRYFSRNHGNNISRNVSTVQSKRKYFLLRLLLVALGFSLNSHDYPRSLRTWQNWPGKILCNRVVMREKLRQVQTVASNKWENYRESRRGRIVLDQYKRRHSKFYSFLRETISIMFQEDINVTSRFQFQGT